MQYGIEENILDNIIKIFRKFEKNKEVIIFGSRAKGNYKIGSDIDLALIGKGIGINDLNKIHIELDKLYLPYGFDLIIFEKIKNDDLIDHINRVGISIYKPTSNQLVH